ncbi:hypothetical protein CFN78_03470 [Amycolatopsis antarctica]|uniref:Antitoxin n=1 Tax=Amycolatopsis antarctica TaxID=1854586 RepID=A0A263DB71_9PSEU|nr:antitoxin [Amycolatopsis antarctica]OZM75228.1 hypothetical protein CFN78_03470 [Amycolatopsis antarctica]
MAMLRKLAALAGAAEAARRYARKNPEKTAQYADKAARFVDKQTKGKYHQQIDSVARKVRDAGGPPGRSDGRPGGY